MIPQKGMIKVSTAFERVIHWYLAITCLLLIITGLGMMFHSLNFLAQPFGGLKSMKTAHTYLGIIFIPALLISALLWWKDAGIFDFPSDIEWLKKGGGYLWHVDDVPETGKYNPGQKLFFLTVVIFGLLMIVSGFMMWFPEGYSRELINWMYALHALGLLAILSFIIVHIYLGTIGVPGSSGAILTGYVPKSWCLKQCPKWLRKKEEDGTLEVYNGN